MPAEIELEAEGRAKLDAALAEDRCPIVLKAEGEGDVDATTSLLVWAGNNLAALLDLLATRAARIAELESMCEQWVESAERVKAAHRQQYGVFSSRIAELEAEVREREDIEEEFDHWLKLEHGVDEGAFARFMEERATTPKETPDEH